MYCLDTNHLSDERIYPALWIVFPSYWRHLHEVFNFDEAQSLCFCSFFFFASAFGVRTKKPKLNPESQRFTPMLFFSKSSIFLAFKIGSLIRFELTCVGDVRQESTFILSSVILSRLWVGH